MSQTSNSKTTKPEEKVNKIPQHLKQTKMDEK